MVNSRNAISECMESALGPDKSCDLVIVNATIGHDYQALIDQVRELAPTARVVGASCCGIVGREGVSESMKDVAIRMGEPVPGAAIVRAWRRDSVG